ncbi:hypothetical protein WMF27_22630 [Sorangium sp. So ce281]|uniref:hypothetical protein n=1 Tax=unclassified Sorangium TaxID=2621164 RepID=UPI003F5F6003
MIDGEGSGLEGVPGGAERTEGGELAIVRKDGGLGRLRLEEGGPACALDGVGVGRRAAGPPGRGRDEGTGGTLGCARTDGGGPDRSWERIDGGGLDRGSGRDDGGRLDRRPLAAVSAYTCAGLESGRAEGGGVDGDPPGAYALGCVRASGGAEGTDGGERNEGGAVDGGTGVSAWLARGARADGGAAERADGGGSVLWLVDLSRTCGARRESALAPARCGARESALEAALWPKVSLRCAPIIV